MEARRDRSPRIKGMRAGLQTKTEIRKRERERLREANSHISPSRVPKSKLKGEPKPVDDDSLFAVSIFFFLIYVLLPHNVAALGHKKFYFFSYYLIPFWGAGDAGGRRGILTRVSLKCRSHGP